jgi:hypothetical protein
LKDTETPSKNQLSQLQPWVPFPQFDWISGGLSTAAFGSQIWGRAGDDIIAMNRANFLRSIGIDPASAISMEQVHGKAITRVGREDRGRGMADPVSRVAASDALITNERRVALVIAHADCAPVFLADPSSKSIAAIHAGWRGALAGVCGDAVRSLKREYAARARDLHVAIGPLISRRHYVVGEEVAGPFGARFGERVVVRNGNGPTLDLFAAIVVDLLAAGVAPEQIPARPACTFASPGLSSWRRDGARMSGMISLIAIK